MKKVVALLLALALFLSFAACGQKTETAAPAETKTETKTEPAQTAEKEPYKFSGTVTIIVPFNAGSNTDNQIRFIQPYLEKHLGTNTIVVNGRVNGQLIMLLHQARDKGREIILLTKHAKNIYESLDACAVSPRLFDEIIHIEPGDEKTRYIKPDSIFIDDSFAERLKVSRDCRIPVFDLDMVESLLDWRG